MPPGDIYWRFFENAPIGRLLLERATGCILEVNSAFLRMAGRTLEEVAGLSFWEPPLIADADAGAEAHRHLLAGGALDDVELPFRAGDGRWLLLEVGGNGANGAIQLEVRDATGREQTRLAERIETLRLLAGRTAAEFQNLHCALETMGEVRLSGVSYGQPVPGELREIQQASERAGAIAGQLLAFSGAIVLQVRPVALNNLVESMLPKLRELFGTEVEIVSDLSPDLAPVITDPVQLRRIILKLAANSRDAMERGGTFWLRTTHAPTVEAGLGATGAGDGPYGMLAVSDSGPGLDDLSWEHLYQPFFSTKAHGRSLGLGLASVYGTVRQSGGRLWAYSQRGKGATFCIYLPLAGTHFPTLPAPPLDALPGNPAILLVEADDAMRTVMSNLLKKRGHRVLAALDSNEAMRITKVHGPPDLLISRPELELAGRLGHSHPQLRVLYLGGYADSVAAQQEGLPPRTALLQKPFSADTFLTTVLGMLSQPL